MKKKFTAALCAASLLILSLSGCGPKLADNNTQSVQKNEGENSVGGKKEGQEPVDSEGQKSSEENTAMGRYVESAVDMSEYCASSFRITRLQDGTLVIPDRYNGKIVSKDNGVTWQQEEMEWLTEIAVKKESYIASISCGTDGSFGVIYEDGSKGEETGEENETDDGKMDMEGLIVRPDGTQIPFQIPVAEEDVWICNIGFSDSGRAFVTTLGRNIYEVKEDGSSEKFLTVNNGRPQHIEFVGNVMVMDGENQDEILLYDIEKKEYVEDEVLVGFVNENYKNRSYSTADCYTMFFFPGEEGVLYLAGDKGLHRHVIGGGAVEQVIDGTLSCFGNPAYIFMGMTMLPDNEFLALFSGNKMVRFTYDPNIPTVPNQRLKLYSLKDNDMIRQAITIYQSDNPEVYVEYEVGMEDGNSITRDDALKKLNTQIMAGQGPDVLVLDSMPAKSYVEKGMLLDLTECINEMEAENRPFDNIVEAFRTDGKVYMLPCEIRLPLISGKEAYISGVEDLEDIADLTEKIREENPGMDIMQICSEKGIMRLFTMVSAPEWKTESGEINKEIIKDFLEQTKRIYDAQMDGLKDEYTDRYRTKSENVLAYYGVKLEDSDFLGDVGWYSIIGEGIPVQFGSAYFRSDITGQFSIGRVKGFEDHMFKPLNGHSKDVFIPKTLVGINAASTQMDAAKKMIRTLFGKSNQSSLFNGFGVTQDSLEALFTIDERYISEDGVYSSMATGTPDGEGVSFDIYWFTDEQKSRTEEWMKQVRVPYVPDQVLEEAVYNEGISFIQGKQTIDEAADAIEQRVSIYMSE